MKKQFLLGCLAVSAMALHAQTGNTCGGTPNPLTTSWEYPMAGFSYNFTMPAASASQVQIGSTNCTSLFTARTIINNDYYNTGVLVNTLASDATSVAAGRFLAQQTGTGNCTAVTAKAIGNNTAANAIGVNANSTGSLSYDNLGLNAPTANGTHASIGVNADISNSSSPINQGHNTEIYTCSSTSTNTGASLTVSTTASTNYGVYAYASGASSFNAAIYGSASTSASNWAGYFNGNVYATGTITSSDRRLKKDIQQLDNSMDIIKKLKPVTYLFDQDSHKNMHMAVGKQYGFIAQEVQEVLPELAAPFVVPAVLDKEGREISPKEEYLGLNYQNFTAIMVSAIQTQQQTIETQQKQIDELKAMVQSLAGAQGAPTAKTQAVALSDKNTIVLDQNVPNPFAESTVVTYNIPTDFAKAQIIFTTIDGKVIKAIDIKEKGRGSLNVFANDLSNGIYTYSLVVDGKVIDAKKMVKE